MRHELVFNNVPDGIDLRLWGLPTRIDVTHDHEFSINTKDVQMVAVTVVLSVGVLMLVKKVLW